MVCQRVLVWRDGIVEANAEGGGGENWSELEGRGRVTWGWTLLILMHPVVISREEDVSQGEVKEDGRGLKHISPLSFQLPASNASYEYTP